MKEFNLKKWLALAGIAIVITPVFCVLVAWSVWHIRVNGRPGEVGHEEEY